MAAPHVAGVAAMLSGLGHSRDEIIDCIITTAINPITGDRGAQDPVYGYGILDAEAAVHACHKQ